MNKFQKLACKCAKNDIKVFTLINFKKCKNDELRMMRERKMNLQEVYEYKNWFLKYV